MKTREETTVKNVKDFTDKANKEILEFFREHLKTSDLDSLENKPEAYIDEVFEDVTPCFGAYGEHTPVYELSQFHTKDGNPATIDFRRDDFIYENE